MDRHPFSHGALFGRGARDSWEAIQRPSLTTNVNKFHLKYAAVWEEIWATPALKPWIVAISCHGFGSTVNRKRRSWLLWFRNINNSTLCFLDAANKNMDTKITKTRRSLSAPQSKRLSFAWMLSHQTLLVCLRDADRPGIPKNYISLAAYRGQNLQFFHKTSFSGW